tara:strand:+ start:130 stop:372 length:243 start_codon:yes stop_codon:yes gene_type:complete
MKQSENEKILREVKTFLKNSENKKAQNNKNSKIITKKDNINNQLSVNELISQEVRLWIKNNGTEVAKNVIEKTLNDILKK